MVNAKKALRLSAAFSALSLLASCNIFYAADLCTLPPLTREGMYADYDSMTETIRTTSPFITLQKKAYGMDMLQILADERDGIEGLVDTSDFFVFLRKTLGLLKSQHLNTMILDIAGNDVLDTMLREELIFKERMDDYHQIDWSLPLVYWNGRYILYKDAVVKGIDIPRLSVLDSIDGESVFAAAERFSPHYTQAYDFTHHRFYGSLYAFSAYLDNAIPGGHAYRFVLPSSEIREASLLATDTVTSQNEPRALWSDPVQYFAGHRILYIKLPMMDIGLVDGYAARIKSEAARGQIDRIIIDICDNGGGSDRAWMNLLSMLIPSDISITSTLGVKQGAKAPDLLQGYQLDYMLKEGKATQVPLLDGETFLVASESMTVSRRADSIDFTGPIYLVVQNIYSAAGSFLAYAAQSDQITSIGIPSDYPLGMGMNPLVFTLPNSGIRFRIEPAIDLGRPDTIAGILGREVEVPLSLSDEEFLAYLNYAGDRCSEEYVCIINPLTKAAIQ